MAESLPSHKDEEWFVWSAIGDSLIGTVDCVLESEDLAASKEVLGVSEWARVEEGDLALMAAAPIGYRMASLVLQHQGHYPAELIAEAEAFMKKIVGSMEKLGVTIYNDHDPLGPRWNEFMEISK